MECYTLNPTDKQMDIDDLLFRLDTEVSPFTFRQDEIDLLTDALDFYKEMQVI